MDISINFNRIALLLKRFFVENKNRELMFWSIATLVFALSMQSGSSATLIYITGFIFASKQYSFFAFKPSGMHFLMIPAT